MTEKICRLCLQTIINNYETIEEPLLKTLKMNLNITKENVTCTECASYLQAFSNFKTGSVYGRDRILPLPKLENDANSDPVEIETTSNLKPRMKTEIKCSFCAITDGKESFVSLNESKKYESLVDMLKQHIPEMKLKNTEELLACEPCLDALQGVVSFILKCLEVEEEINRYIEMEGADVKGQVELKDVRQFICSSRLKLEIESFDANKDWRCDEIKKEYECTMTAEAEIKREEVNDSELVIKTEDVFIESEQSNCYDSCHGPCIKNETAGDPLEMSLIISRKKDIKQDVLTHKSASEIKKFQCEMCPYKAKRKGHLKLHLLTHADPSEINMFKCEACPYRAKHKFVLKQHSLVHKSPSELIMFKCETCPYESKLKHNLNAHLLTHRGYSEKDVIKCETCSYKTHSKTNLKRHLLSHKSPSEKKMFKCETCSYETRIKSYLRNHSLIHKSPSEVDMFKCDKCSYETKRKDHLKCHVLTHGSSSEINTFKCEICSYETKNKSYLKSHSLTHTSPSEVKMFKCEACPYETNRKGNLQRHVLTHRSPSEINMFKCELCLYETKHKYCLKTHLLTHQSPAETNTFKCGICTYTTQLRSSIRNHLLVHKSPLEMDMHKCKMCLFETKRKHSLKIHLLKIHRSCSEIKTFKRNACPYGTTHKSNGSRIRNVKKRSKVESRRYKGV